MHYTNLPIVRENADNEHVRLLRRAVNQWISTNNAGDAPLSVERTDFNASLVCYTKGFQSRHVDPQGIALSIDGIVGRKTWFALGDYTDLIDNRIIEELAITGLGEDRDIVARRPPEFNKISALAQSTLEIAMQEIGVQEDPIGSNRGLRVETYQSEGPSDNSAPGLPWCASFVSWCHYKAVEKISASMRFGYSASSRQIESDLRASNRFTDIGSESDLSLLRPADVLVWFRCGELNPASGHIGLVHHYDQRRGILYTIEGNRRHRVWAGKYALDKSDRVRLIEGLIGFGRF